MFHIFMTLFNSIFLLTANSLIIKASKEQPENRMKKGLLEFTGLINIIVLCMLWFLPSVFIQNYTYLEYQLFKTYKLFKSLILPITSFLTFGVLIMLYGHNNKLKYLFIGAISLIFAFGANIINSILYFGIILDRTYILNIISPRADFIWIAFFICSNISTTSYIFGISLYIVHSVLNRDKFLVTGIILIILQQLGSAVIYQIVSFLL